MFQPARRLGALLMPVLLAACGGGDDPSGGIELPEAAHWLASVAHDGQGLTVRVWDPAAPTTRQKVWAADEPTEGQALLLTQAWTVDAATGTRQLAGDVLAFHAHEGHLYRVLLLGDRSHARVQVSSLDTVCGLTAAEATDWQGGPLLTALRDAHGTAQWLLASGPSGQSGRDALWTVDLATGVGTHLVESDEGRSHDGDAAWLAAGLPGSGLGWVRVGGAVRQLGWDADGVQLGSTVLDSVYSIDTCSGRCAPLPDGLGGMVYIVGSDSVRHLTVDGTLDTLTYLDPEDTTLALALAGGQVVWSATDYFADAVWSVPLAGGSATRIASLIVSGTDDYQSLLGVSGSAVVLRTSITEAGESRARLRYQLVEADGSATTDLAGQALAVVRSASETIGRPAELTAVLRCLDGVTTCAGKAVTEQSLASGAQTALGTLQGELDDSWYGTALRQGLPGALLGYHSGSTQPDALWQLSPGSAGSLAVSWTR